MSSTNRGGDRHASDYYITPVEPILTFLDHFRRAEPKFYPTRILDACAGGDVEHEMSYPTALGKMGLKEIDTIDIREDSKAGIKADYLTYQVAKKYHFIITNPPFALAVEFLEKALKDTMPGGFVAMLLRLNFLGSEKRFYIFKDNLPKHIFVHHKRMSFTGDGKTDSIEYAHFVWQKGVVVPYSQLKVI